METQEAIKAQRQAQAAAMMERLRDTLPPILDAYPVAAAYVYGSVARGTMTPFSDVDIALLLKTPADADTSYSSQPSSDYDRLMLELTIQGEIEETLGFSPVDVRSINAAPLLVQGHIIQNGIRIYERDHAQRVAFEVATRKRYFDFAPVARRLQVAFLNHIHEKGLRHG
jgi:predicted nucleotidyltransferase